MTTKEQVLEILKKTLQLPEVKSFSHLKAMITYLRKQIETEVTEPQVKQLKWEDNMGTALVIHKKELICYEIFININLI
jgi:hypothetical protein